MKITIEEPAKTKISELSPCDLFKFSTNGGTYMMMKKNTFKIEEQFIYLHLSSGQICATDRDCVVVFVGKLKFEE